MSKGRNITQYWLRPLLSIDLKEFWQQKMWKTVIYIFKRSTTCVLIELQFQILWYLKIRCHNVQNKSALRGCYSIWIFIAKSGKKCIDLYRGHWLPIETIDNNESWVMRLIFIQNSHCAMDHSRQKLLYTSPEVSLFY